MTIIPDRENCQYVGDHDYEKQETNQLPNYVPVNHKKLQLVIEQQQMNVEYQPSEKIISLLPGHNFKDTKIKN